MCAESPAGLRLQGHTGLRLQGHTGLCSLDILFAREFQLLAKEPQLRAGLILTLFARESQPRAGGLFEEPHALLESEVSRVSVEAPLSIPKRSAPPAVLGASLGQVPVGNLEVEGRVTGR